MALEQFDTQPPGNYDDEDLSSDGMDPKEVSMFTDMAIPLAFKETFLLRLKIVKFLNDIGSTGTYEETLRLDTEFRSAYKHLRGTIQTSSANGERTPSDFQLRALDYMMSRYLLALHVPCFSASMRDKTFAYSKTVVIDTAMKIWDAASPSIASTGTQDTLSRLILHTSGFYRVNASHAITILALDMRSQLRKEDSLGPVNLRKDQLEILRDTREWHLRCIETGEVSCKGYLCVCLLAAQIEGLMRGLSKPDLINILVNAAEDALEKVLPILEERAASLQPDRAMTEMDFTAMDSMPTSLAGWNYLAIDGMFDFGELDTMNWGSNAGTLYGF